MFGVMFKSFLQIRTFLVKKCNFVDNTCKHWIRSVCKITWTLTATHLRRKKICLRDVNGAILCQFEESCSVDPLGQVRRTGNDEEHPEDGTVEDEKEPEDEEQRVGPVEHLQYDADFVRIEIRESASVTPCVGKT